MKNLGGCLFIVIIIAVFFVMILPQLLNGVGVDPATTREICDISKEICQIIPK